MFVFLCLLILVCLTAPLTTGAVWPLLVAVLPLLLVAAAVRQILSHPGAAVDLIQGGVLGIERDDTHKLSWLDWELGLSRWVEIDHHEGVLRVEQRLLCGLIPAGNLERSLSSFYTVSTPGDSAALRLELRSREGDHVLVMDAGKPSGEQATRLIGQLRERLLDKVDARRLGMQASERGLARRIARGGDLPPPQPVVITRPGPCQLQHDGSREQVRRVHLQGLALGLEEGRSVRSSRSGGWVSGRRGDRHVVVATWLAAERKRGEDLTRYTLSTSSQAPLRVRRPVRPLRADLASEGGQEALYELTLGAGWRSLSEDEALTEALEELFGPHGLRELSLERGALYAEKEAADQDLCPSRLSPLFDALGRVAQICEDFRSQLVGTLVAYDQPRCPFCRDDLSSGEERVKCEQCGVQHHAECFTDMGGCTIRGCSGQRGEPVVGGGASRPSSRLSNR